MNFPFLLNHLQEPAIGAMLVECVPTRKNVRVKEFYEKLAQRLGERTKTVNTYRSLLADVKMR